MAGIIYTADQISELTTLANEARELDAAWRAAMDDAGEIINRVVGEQYLGWEIHYNDQLSDLIDAIHADYTTAPFQYIPHVGEFAVRPLRAAEWRKLNNKCRREIAKTQKAIETHK